MCSAIAFYRLLTILILFIEDSKSVILPGRCPKVNLTPASVISNGTYHILVKTPFEVTESYFFDNRTREACSFDIEGPIISFREHGKECPLATGEMKKQSDPGKVSAEIFLSKDPNGVALSPPHTEKWIFFHFENSLIMMWSCRDMKNGSHDEALLIINDAKDDKWYIMVDVIANLTLHMPKNSINGSIAFDSMDTAKGTCSSEKDTCKTPFIMPFLWKRLVFFISLGVVLLIGVILLVFWPRCKCNNIIVPT